MGLLGIAENSNLGCASYGKTTGKPRGKERKALTEEGAETEG